MQHGVAGGGRSIANAFSEPGSQVWVAGTPRPEVAFVEMVKAGPFAKRSVVRRSPAEGSVEASAQASVAEGVFYDDGSTRWRLLADGVMQHDRRATAAGLRASRWMIRHAWTLRLDFPGDAPTARWVEVVSDQTARRVHLPRLVSGQPAVVRLEQRGNANPATRWTAWGVNKVESTFTLVGGWDPTLETADDVQYERSQSDDLPAYRDVLRAWVLNEDGRYSGAPFFAERCRTSQRCSRTRTGRRGRFASATRFRWMWRVKCNRRGWRSASTAEPRGRPIRVASRYS